MRIDRHASVAVLRTNGNLQALGIQIDSVIGIKLDRADIHFGKPLNRRTEQRARAFKIPVRLGGKNRKTVLQAFGIVHKVQIYTVSLFYLLCNQQVDLGGAVCFSRIKGPLIAFEKDQSKRFRAQRIIEKFAFVSFGIHANITR